MFTKSISIKMWLAAFTVTVLLLIGLPSGTSVGLEEQMLAQAALGPETYPPDPVSDYSWSAGYNGVADIQAAFNDGRHHENIALPNMVMPSQTDWNARSDSEKALFLINSERSARGVPPLHGVESNVTSVAQNFANYLFANNVFDHFADGLGPWVRLSNNPAIGACQDFLSYAENLYVYMTDGNSISLPVERSIYVFLYKDSGSLWEHRHALLWYPYNDNSGPAGIEGFMGVGRASGGPWSGGWGYDWNFVEIIVYNTFDPCATWIYSQPQNIKLYLPVVKRSQ